MLRADHHTHLFSPDAAERISRLQVFEPVTADELLAVLDRDQVGWALVLSVAYFFAMPDLGDADRKGLSAENDWTARQVDAHQGRLRACCSVNPVAPGAIDEIDRCAESGSFVGVKLHLANSDLDLRDRAHLDAIGDVAECADRHGLMLVVHLRTRRADYGADDANRFIEAVVPRAPDVPIQIAHAAGWGAYDSQTGAAFEAFADWITTTPSAATNLYFDIALEPLVYEPDEQDAIAPRPGQQSWHAGRFDHLVTQIKRIGPSRVAFGTDWPLIDPAPYLAQLRDRLPLDPGSFDAMLRATTPMPSSQLPGASDPRQ